MADQIIVRRTISDSFEACMAQGRVLFFCAPCGFGKTCVANALVAGKNVLRLSAADPDFQLPSRDDDWSIALIDDLQNISDEETWQALYDLIRNCPDRRFLLLSRGAPRGSLMVFQYTGLMTVLESNALFFDREDVRRMLDIRSISYSESDISGIMKKSRGFPLGVAITARKMEQGLPFSPELVGQSYQEVFLYFEAAVFKRLDSPVRRFILEMSLFDSFDLEMARMVTGSPKAGEILDWLQRNTSMLLYDDVLRFRFWKEYQMFLLWEMGRLYTPERKRALLIRGGMYYELKEAYPRALDCYTEGWDHTKVSELLIRSAENFPGMNHYREMEKYYRSLPESEIYSSPALMQGMSMVCALSGDYEGSERWYRELEKFGEQCMPQDAILKQVRSSLVWLDISLPQRSVEKMAEIFPKVTQMLRRKEISLPPFSVTSGRPALSTAARIFPTGAKRTT